ncbi:hypothetical protein D3C71_1021670 [compost metagenome]
MIDVNKLLTPEELTTLYKIYQAFVEPAEIWEHLVADGTYDEIVFMVLARFIDREFGKDLVGPQVQAVVDYLSDRTE